MEDGFREYDHLTIYPVILAGGGGKRLWPLSDPCEPKPFLKLGNRETLFSATVQRVLGLAGPERLRVVCGGRHAHLATRDLEALGIDANGKLTLEPVPRNTGPAVLLQALQLLKEDPDAMMVVLPADHLIEPMGKFHDAIQHAVIEASDRLVLFGIVPTRAETGYGYIETESSGGIGQLLPVTRFVEKPDGALAKTYLESGRHLWNAGIFVFGAAVICEAFQRHQPLMYEKVVAYLEGDRQAFADAPSLSIDVSVMELSRKTAVIPVDFEWNDVGNWSAFKDMLPVDQAGNAVLGDTQLVDCENCLVVGEGATVAGLGLKDLVVVSARNQVLVVPKSRSGDLKSLVDGVQASDGNAFYRPWGRFVILDRTPGSLTKRIDILPHSRTSLQKHLHREEHWVVLQGTLRVTKGAETFLLEPGQATLIPKGAVHRLENAGDEVVSLIEVQKGDLLSESDIVRLQDDYGRKTEDRTSMAG